MQQQTYITIAAIAPVRAEASHKAEQVTQLLLGETAVELVQEKHGEFLKVKGSYDGYEGWVQKAQLASLKTLPTDTTVVVPFQLGAHAVVNDVRVPMLPGSECYKRRTEQHYEQQHALECGKHKILFPDFEQLQAAALTGEILVSTAMYYLGAPYLWGGKTPWGIDCSGLMQMCFKLNQVFLPRDAWQQAEGGDDVGFLDEGVAGDLAFFDNDKGRINHVGMLMGNNKIIHASAQVRIDDMDSSGIIHSQSRERTHRLRLIRRFV